MRTPRTCGYVKQDEHLCGSPALRGRDYCYFHVDRVKRQQRAEKQQIIMEEPLCLPSLEDINAIQSALMQVMMALLEERIGSKIAGQLLYALQLARTNLQRAAELPGEETTRIRMTLMQVMHELLLGRMGSRVAGRLLYAVQSAMRNLKPARPAIEDEPDPAAARQMQAACRI